MKKYNVIKTLYLPSKEEVFTIARSVTFEDAVNLINEHNELQKCALFQDTGDVDHSDVYPFFWVNKNGIDIKFSIEISVFDMIADLVRPDQVKLKTFDLCLN